jgi:hypothetical protein
MRFAADQAIVHIGRPPCILAVLPFNSQLYAYESPSMKLILDGDKFDEHQAIFIGAIIEQIKRHLEEAGLEGAKLKEVTGNIAFSIACTIDDTAGIEYGGTEVNPYLTFLHGDDEIMHCGGNSYTHEYVFGILDEVFGE